ncbi:hypothetical protein EV702DRAFT_1051749 [Suillus placidus]|uniref:Uncharacterized protein n=1 Tax=Suillus placidus TaxID=48579 RepID=A0A9P6ZFJ9_9AGAM|nr:hypothetical protein EV702DRAFT_1051749 [Suillus placidus]
MSNHGESTTQTVSSSGLVGGEFDQSSINQCLKFVGDYHKGIFDKADALLEIQKVLQASISESSTLTQLDFKPGLLHYLKLLDHVHDNDRQGSEQVRSDEARSDNKRLRERLHRRGKTEEAESDDSGDREDYHLRSKRRKLTPERLQFYPWLQPENYRFISKQKGEQLTLDCYEEWAKDPKYYRGQITSTMGCPSFPTLQWTLLLEGQAPDLEKVLSGHYSMAIDPKQTQSLGKGFEIILSQPSSTH